MPGSGGRQVPDVLPRSTRAGYGLGSVATGSFGAVPGLLLLPLLTDTLGVAAGLAGLLVFVPKAWDVVVNPLVGRLSDRRGTQARRPMMLVGGLALAALFVIMFLGPHTRVAGAAWVVVAYLACSTAYAFFQVPYMALPAELTRSHDERTRLMTWRVAVLAVAILVSGGLAPVVRDAAGYAGVGVFVGALIAVGVVTSWHATRHVRSGVVAGEGTLRDQLAVVASTPSFRRLLTVWVVQALATGAMLSGVDYVARRVLHDAGAASVLFVCFVGPALVVTPWWQRQSERHGKRRGYVISSLTFAVGTLATAATLQVGVAAAAVSLAVVGVGYAGMQLFPMAMLPDEAAADAERHGENRVGVFTGVWTAGETLGLAVGPFAYAACLALGGYESGGGDAQSASARAAVVLGFTVVPATLVLASVMGLRGRDAAGSRAHAREEGGAVGERLR